MLSKENVEKIVITGLYRHEPDKRYRSSLYWDNLYWCYNWTFKVRYDKEDDTWYMVDTYFDEKCIELTDDNFDEFEFVFDFKDVEEISKKHISDYDDSDIFCVAVDSGGMYCGRSYFVKKGAVKSKDRIIKRLEYEIERLESDLRCKKETLERIKNGEYLKYV